MSSFSLAFPVIQLIHEHHTLPAENRVLRFVQQQLLDRILGASLSSLALLDVTYHLSAFVIKSIKAPFKAIYLKEKLSFHEALIHLKIAALFRSTVLFGSINYFFSPSSVSTLFENSLTRMIRGLLLSGNPEVFINSKKAGAIRTTGIGGVMNHVSLFMNLVDKLSPEIKESMQGTISLMKESMEFAHGKIDLRVKESTYNSLYEICSEGLTKFTPPADASLKDKLQYGVAIRSFSIFLALLSIPIAVFEIIKLPFEILGLCLEFGEALVSNQESDLKTSLWLFKLNLISKICFLLAIPLCLTLGLYDPKKIQFLFSPLYSGDNEIIRDSYKKLFYKVAYLPVGKSVLIPLWSCTSNYDLIKKDSAHAFCILITRQHENYRLSIINRGYGSGYHPKHDANNSDIDYSWDNMDLDFLNTYLQASIFTNRPEVQKIREETAKKFKSDQFTSFVYSFLYFLAEDNGGKRFESHHHKRLQRIGNCGVSSLLGAMSFHSSMQANDMQDKGKYKKLVYALKKNTFKNHGYLLDFDLSIKREVHPAAVVQQALSKAKSKLKK